MATSIRPRLDRLEQRAAAMVPAGKQVTRIVLVAVEPGNMNRGEPVEFWRHPNHNEEHECERA